MSHLDINNSYITRIGCPNLVNSIVNKVDDRTIFESTALMDPVLLNATVVRHIQCEFFCPFSFFSFCSCIMYSLMMAISFLFSIFCYGKWICKCIRKSLNSNVGLVRIMMSWTYFWIEWRLKFQEEITKSLITWPMIWKYWSDSIP